MFLTALSASFSFNHTFSTAPLRLWTPCVLVYNRRECESWRATLSLLIQSVSPAVGSSLTLFALWLKEMATGTKENTRHTLSSVSHTWQVSIFLPQNNTFSDLFTFKKAKYIKKEVAQTLQNQQRIWTSRLLLKVMVFSCIMSKTLWTLVEV